MGLSLTSRAGVNGNAPYQAQELQITTLANLLLYWKSNFGATPKVAEYIYFYIESLILVRPQKWLSISTSIGDSNFGAGPNVFLS